MLDKFSNEYFIRHNEINKESVSDFKESKLE